MCRYFTLKKKSDDTIILYILTQTHMQKYKSKNSQNKK
jgi:hypothetical protein